MKKRSNATWGFADTPYVATRYSGLSYRHDAPGLWRIYDMNGSGSPSAVGPFYRTRAELLADLHRFATVGGWA